MNETLRIALLIGLLLYFVCIFWMLKKNSINLKYTLLWIFTGVLMVLIVAFPWILKTVMGWIGVVEWVNGLFALFILFLIIICMSITSIVSKMNDRNRRLVQTCAIYDKNIRELEKRVAELEERLKDAQD